MHPWLAFLCFFRLLFGRRLPAEAAKYLPEDSQPKQLPAPSPPEKPVEKPKPVGTTSQRASTTDGALSHLALLPRQGRFVDFVRDSVDGASDADIGAAAREVHRGCRKVLDQILTFEPVMPGAEEEKVSVPKGFDPSEVRLIGEAKGDPPYRGTLRHHGWRVVDARLPTLAEGVDRTVIAPAEVEL
jgi:hypothetical protein